MASHRRRAPITVVGTGQLPVVSAAPPADPDRAPAVDSPTTALPIDRPGVRTAPGVGIREVFRRFWPFTRGFRGRLTLGLVMVGVPPLMAAAGIWLFKILVDDVLTKRDTALFPKVALAFLVINVLEGVLGFVDEYLTAWVGERFVLTLRTQVFGHLQKLPLTFFERHQLGDILSRLTGDIGAVESLVLSGLNQALTYSFQIVFFAGALFVLDWRLAIAAFVAAPLFLLLARFFSARIRTASREQRRRSGSIAAVAEESLHNVALVQAYHRQDHEAMRFHRENLASFMAQMVAIKIESLFAPFTSLLQSCGVLLVIGFGLRELIAGRMTVGGLLVFLGYLSQLYGPISGFGSLSNSVYAAGAGAERIIELLDTRPEVTDPANPVELDRARGELRVENVGYRYPDSGRPALADVSFAVRPGETVAVVGASGAGKSTLLRVLLRLSDPHSGAVTLDGVDARDLRVAQLRANIAVVLQDTLVFDGTVAENIEWGRPGATREEVEQAARAADAHGFVTGLPQGYHTRVGQRGMMLSGGQRQRIALARAMIRDAPVLLLDEPTTGLDAASTHRVMEPLRRAMAGRATIVISHNLLTVTDADRIVYLERGRVAGYGTHSELLARCPGYAELHRLHRPDAGHPVRRVPAPRPVPRPAGPVSAPTPRRSGPTPLPTPRPTVPPTPARRSGPTPLPTVARPSGPTRGPVPVRPRGPVPAGTPAVAPVHPSVPAPAPASGTTPAPAPVRASGPTPDRSTGPSPIPTSAPVPPPARPPGPTPVRPSGPTPVRPSGPTPVRPSGPTPVRPSGSAPVRPPGPTALRPTGPEPLRPSESGPVRWSGDTHPGPPRPAGDRPARHATARPDAPAPLPARDLVPMPRPRPAVSGETAGPDQGPREHQPRHAARTGTTDPAD